MSQSPSHSVGEHQRRERVLVFRSELLPLSETFVAAQAAAQRSFDPILVGLKHVAHGLVAESDCRLLASSGSIAASGRRWLYRNMGVAPSFYRQLAELRPVLIHAHFAVDGTEALPLTRALDLPLIVTLHGYDVMLQDTAHARSARGRRFLRTRADLWERAELFLCVSDAVRRKALERGFPGGKLLVHHIGTDTDALAKVQPVARDRHTVLFVGRLVEKKGCIHLLRAMAGVRRQVERARLVIIGDGPLRVLLEREAERLGVAATFLGTRARHEVRAWMQSARLLAVPSVTAADGDAEGLPTVLFEAMTLGLPVAAFRSSGIGELVQHRVNGLLAAEQDEHALAAHIVELLEDDSLCECLAGDARRTVESEYRLSSQTAELEQHYRRAIEAYQLEGQPACACGLPASRQAAQVPSEVPSGSR